MTPPLICPPPGSPDPDCPLYEQRVAFSPGEALRRAILTERLNAPDLAALIRAEHQQSHSLQAALPPARSPGSVANLDQLLEEVNE
jgi:hypothetical protein